jgi:hypothetical protein
LAARTGRPVNFVRNSSPDYQQVQSQIFGLIRAELPGADVSETVEERRDDAINFGIHIRLGRGERQVPMPLDVLMSHGLADKDYLLLTGLDGRRLINAYEHVLVAGSWFRSKLLLTRFHPVARRRVRLARSQIHLAGWPRLDLLLRQQQQQQQPRQGRVRVLWAPSHNMAGREHNYSSYPAFEDYLPRLEQAFEVRVSLHPSNRTDKSPTAGDLQWADAVVTDFGTMLYEAWALGKCVVMPDWLFPDEMLRGRGTQKRSAEGRVYSRGIGDHAGNIDELCGMLAAAKPPGRDVTAFMDRILAPEYRGVSARRVAELLLTLPLKRRAG